MKTAYIMVSLGIIALAAACAQSTDGDTAQGSDNVTALHSVDEAKKVVETLYTREFFANADPVSLLSPAMAAYYNQAGGTHGGGINAITCGQDPGDWFVVDAPVVIGNQAYTNVHMQFNTLPVIVNLNDLKVSFIGCTTNFRQVVVGTGGPCVAGGAYCGGDKVSGDKGTLYRCVQGQSGVEAQSCARGCEIRPAGEDDRCKP